MPVASSPCPGTAAPRCTPRSYASERRLTIALEEGAGPCRVLHALAWGQTTSSTNANGQQRCLHWEGRAHCPGQPGPGHCPSTGQAKDRKALGTAPPQVRRRTEGGRRRAPVPEGGTHHAVPAFHGLHPAKQGFLAFLEAAACRAAFRWSVRTDPDPTPFPHACRPSIPVCAHVDQAEGALSKSRPGTRHRRRPQTTTRPWQKPDSTKVQPPKTAGLMQRVLTCARTCCPG